MITARWPGAGHEQLPWNEATTRPPSGRIDYPNTTR